MIEFKYIKESENPVYFKECESCGWIAPLIKAEAVYPNPARMICEVCCTSHCGNVIHDPRIYGIEFDVVARMIAETTNLLLDKLTDRRKEII